MSDELRLPPVRPAIERLTEGWDALMPELDPVLADLGHAQKMRLLEILLQVGVAIEELRP